MAHCVRVNNMSDDAMRLTLCALDRRKQLERIRRKDLEIQKQTNQIAQLQTDLRKAERVHVFSQQAASGQGSMSRMCFEANVSKFEISKESARQIRVYNQCAVKKQAASGSSSRELEGDIHTIHVGGTYMLSARMPGVVGLPTRLDSDLSTTEPPFPPVIQSFSLSVFQSVRS
jgi:hypothetical protein